MKLPVTMKDLIDGHAAEDDREGLALLMAQERSALALVRAKRHAPEYLDRSMTSKRLIAFHEDNIAYIEIALENLP